MLKQFGINTNEIYQECFLKIPVLNQSTKRATATTFLEHPFHSVLLPETEQK